MINHLGGKDTAAKSLKSIEDWSKGDTGTNSSGFSALPGGNCSKSGHFFDDDGDGGYWWSSSESSSNEAYYRAASSRHSLIYEYNYGKEFGFSVRCLKD